MVVLVGQLRAVLELDVLVAIDTYRLRAGMSVRGRYGWKGCTMLCRLLSESESERGLRTDWSLGKGMDVNDRCHKEGLLHAVVCQCVEICHRNIGK